MISYPDFIWASVFKIDLINPLPQKARGLTVKQCVGVERAYNLYFSASKLSNTRASRVEKCIKQMLSGKGLND